MDFFSALANTVSLLAAATPLAQRGAVEREFHDCLGRALRQGLALQVEDDNGQSASFVASALKPKSVFALFALTDEPPAGRRRAHALEDALIGTRVLADRIDIPRLAEDTARLLGPEIERSAVRPGSALAIPLLLARTKPSPDQPVDAAEPALSSFTRTGAGARSNLVTLPLGDQPVDRPEQAAVEQRLAEHRMVVLAGGPGVGKSVLAESVGRARDADGALLWWVRATTEQQRVDAAIDLLIAFAETPGDDPCAQTRSLLSQENGWTAIIDDAPDFDAVAALIPAEHPHGAVVVTTRSAASFPKHAVVAMDAADEVTLAEIARRRLPDDVSADDVAGLVAACAGNPLILSTACRYCAETGASPASVRELLRTKPSRILAGSAGSHVDGFVGVLESIRAGARSPLSWPLLLAVAVGGGSAVPRALLETVFADAAEPADAAIDLDDAFRELLGLGVLTVRTGALESHALTASIVIDLSDPAQCADAAKRMLAAVQSLADDPGRRPPAGLASIVDAADAFAPPDDPVRVMARILLAERLAEQGLVDSAQRQVDAARAIAFVSSVRPARLAIDQSEARILLLSGDSAGARALAERIISDPVADDSLRAAAQVTRAWAAEALGDPGAARDAALELRRLAPDDDDAVHLADHFLLSSQPADARVERYLELAEKASERMRGHYWGQACRSAIEAGRAPEAVGFAERALAADRAFGGERSLHEARDLNDLAMALIATGQLDDAEVALQESISIYREELESHAHVALPLMHLGRLLTERMQDPEADRATLIARSRAALDEAISLQRIAAPHSEDLAAMLVARGDVDIIDGRPEPALDAFREAAAIDTAVRGSAHRDVAIDVNRMMSAHLLLRDPEAVLRTFAAVSGAVPVWEADEPAIALEMRVHQALALLALPRSKTLQRAALGTAAAQIAALCRTPDLSAELREIARDALRRAAAEQNRP